jgi:hypothetical protein
MYEADSLHKKAAALPMSVGVPIRPAGIRVPIDFTCACVCACVRVCVCRGGGLNGDSSYVLMKVLM